MNHIEIMAPVGSFASLQAAIQAGADSVYFGVGKLNMRARTANFQLHDLEEFITICQQSKIKSYLTLNTVVYDDEFDEIKRVIDEASRVGISAVIAMDSAVINYARKINLAVHISTQANISNYSSVVQASQVADVVVLARELSLERIHHIAKKIEEDNLCGPSGALVKLEAFVHGALCIAISGKCGMSLSTFDQSANRGSCIQNCRRAYTVTDSATGESLELDNQYVMSPRDLCTLGMLEKLIDAGISVLKIEGRGRSPDYVHTVVSAYKRAADAIEKGVYSADLKNELIEETMGVFNRGFWQGGYYLGLKTGEWANADGSRAKQKKQHVGIIEHYYTNIGVCEIKVQATPFALEDELLVIGNKTGVVRLKVSEIHINHTPTECANKGDCVGVKITDKVRRGDKVYLLKDSLCHKGLVEN